jgi:hypothetical protein
MDTVSYADLINAHFDGAADFLLVELREELATRCLNAADIDTVEDVVRELILVRRV